MRIDRILNNNVVIIKMRMEKSRLSAEKESPTRKRRETFYQKS